MRFRTEIESIKSDIRIEHDTPLVMLGSCFTDEVGKRLERDGFDVLHNPFGPLFNPISLQTCVRRALSGSLYSKADLTEGPRGFHCLDYATRYSGADSDSLLRDINTTLDCLAKQLRRQPVVILTLGSAFVYRYRSSGSIVGNCHKFAATDFSRELLSPDEVYRAINEIYALVKSAGARDVILTVSPIRHLADGLHGNTVSKSMLHAGVHSLLSDTNARYFPAYEILLDDLRDYRFYATDMKHPSEQAVDYIYDKFSQTYFSKETIQQASEARRRFLAAQHRPILDL